MDGDELMGRSSWSPGVNENLSDSPAVVTPTHERRASGGAPPPANAFVHTSASERWSQYEHDTQLEKESARAHANAVASARAASVESAVTVHESMYSGGSRPYYDLPHQDRVRAEALRVLERAGGDVAPYPLRQTSSGGLTTGGKAAPYSLVRSVSTEAGTKNRVEPYTSEPYSLRRSSSNSFSDSPDRSRRRPPAALAGLDLKNAVPARHDSNKWSIDDEEDLVLHNEEDLVEIVTMENRITGSRQPGGGHRDNPNAEYKHNRSSSNPSSSWSSRYSVDQFMSGGSTTKEVLARIERDEQRLAQSARNMFMTTPTSSPSKVTTNLFGSGFTFRQNSASLSPDTNLRTVWSDNDPLTSNGNSLQRDNASSGGNGFNKARRRRRLCMIGSLLAVCLVVIIGALAGTSKKQSGYSIGNSDGKPTTFYVMADVPYDSDEETKLTRDVEGLPGDATFVIHLGNIQDASVTLCPEYAYEDASAVLKTSPAPVFMLPGENDWNNCPDPSKSWDDWSANFMDFDSYFKPDWTVLHQSDKKENFSFWYNGIIFIGLHLVGGRIHDQDEWNSRQAMNVDWLGENIHTIYKSDDYRAVVLLGNARPSSQQRSFFNEALGEIRQMGKPVVYIHANAGDVADFTEYKPYDDVDNLMAVQVEQGGRSPPLRVTVDFGPKPFLFG
jgi:hypothetical protein